MIMKILIIGENSKEHALAHTLERQGQHEVLVIPGNAGTVEFEQSVEDMPVSYNPDDILGTVSSFKPDTIIVCDEKLIHEGWPERLKGFGAEVIAPSQEAADLIDAKPKWGVLMQETKIPVADFEVFSDYDRIFSFFQQFPAPFVLKEVSGKKRFAIPYNEDEASEILDDWYEDGPTEVMVSEFQNGTRFNLPVLVWKERIIPFRPFVIQRGIYDHEDDAQAKGMGAVCPADDLLYPHATGEAVNKIIVPLLKELQKKGIQYTGFLSGEFVSTINGPVCVNLKTGLSETGSAAMFPLLESDLMEAWASLKAGKKPVMNWSGSTCVSTVMAGSEYPEAPSIGKPITFDDDFEGILTCNHVREENGQLQTNGGRVLVIASRGKDRAEAAEKNLECLGMVHCDDLFYRTDIGMQD